MATGKNSFILYKDYVHAVDLLTNEQSGKLLKHILNYVNDFDPVESDPIVRIAFEPIKQQLKRDLKQWRSEKKRRSAAGKIGGKKSGEIRRSKTKQNKAIVHSASKNEANEAVTVFETVIVNDTVTTNNINIKPDENFKIDLPELKINTAIEYLSRTRKTQADRELVLSLWTAFKEKNFTGEKSYSSEAKIFAHFFETLKFEKINGTHQQTFNSKTKPGTSEARTEALKKW